MQKVSGKNGSLTRNKYLAYDIYLMVLVLHLQRKLLPYDSVNLPHCCFTRWK